mmetsp:Transcript_5109/g.12564  ORF Transcript_5109/g.12564 Transcript_5109/m.12564 type:complete len:96 (+) Transcript_5109:2313-2600(+)
MHGFIFTNTNTTRLGVGSYPKKAVVMGEDGGPSSNANGPVWARYISVPTDRLHHAVRDRTTGREEKDGFQTWIEWNDEQACCQLASQRNGFQKAH